MQLANVAHNSATSTSELTRSISSLGLAAIILGAAVLSAVVTGLLFEHSPRSIVRAPEACSTSPQRDAAHDLREGTVTRVLHGDTLLLDGATKVRLIGVDTLSPADPRADVAACGEASRSFVASLVENKRVRLEYEGPHLDDFGRIRAHVYLEDGRLLSAELVNAGYAIARGKLQSRVDPMLRDLDENARVAKVGLWAEKPAVSSAETTVGLASISSSEVSTNIEPLRSGDPYVSVTPTRGAWANERPAPVSPVADTAGYGRSLVPNGLSSVPVQPPAPVRPSIAENGSCYGEVSAATGRPKTVYVSGYIRRDGTYVQSYFRSRPR